MNRRSALSRTFGWRAKAAVLAVLSRIPGGRSLYRTLQDASGTSRLDIAAQYSNKRLVLRALRAKNIDVTGDVVEIGTGWHPVMPLLLSLLGARSVTTIDLNPWLSERSLIETLRGLTTIAPTFEEDFGIPSVSTRQLMHDLSSAVPRVGVQEALRSARIEYQPRIDGSATGLPSSSFDLIISTGLLEHVPPPIIAAMAKESARILRVGGAVCHNVNPGDHFATDKRITKINFLRYSPRTWYWIGGSGLSYHNRLRASDYRVLLTAGFELREWQTRIDPISLAHARTSANLHRDFRHYELEDLCADDILVVLTRAAT